VPDYHIFQIYYSEATRQTLDGGFIPLDNTPNERPDWSEYWPIRNFLLQNKLVDEDFYGFLSPKFGEKTRLAAAEVHNFLRRSGVAAEVALFSPFFDQSAYYLNTFEQAANVHARMIDACRQCAPLIAPNLELFGTVMCSLNTVYSNFLVAKPSFWRRWFEICEIIFRIAEKRNSELADILNAPTGHRLGSAPIKVFIIERVASALLTCERRWRVIAYNPMKMQRFVEGYEYEQILMDALKIAYTVQGYEQYIQAFFRIRDEIIRQLQLT
jgi:hypothetical protein